MKTTFRSLAGAFALALLFAVASAQVLPDSPQPASSAAIASPEFITIPKDTEVELVALEQISSAETKLGSTVQFAVAKDVIVDGTTVIHAGTLVNGTVTKVKRGSSKKHKWGYLRIDLSRVSVGSQTNLSLTGIFPQDRKTLASVIKSGATNVGLAALAAPILPFIVIYSSGEAIDDRINGAHLWGEARLPLCYHKTAFVSSKQEIPVTDLPDLPKEGNAVGDGQCFVSGTRAPHVNWSGTGPGLLDIR
jgi:hypothetical protein